MLKIIPVFLLLFTGYLCNALSDETWSFSPTKGGIFWDTITSIPFEQYGPPETETNEIDHGPAERSLPTVVLAGVSIALVLLCVLIVGIFWYAWKKSQEGSMVLNPIRYGEAGVSLQNPSAPGSLQEWPSERAVP